MLRQGNPERDSGGVRGSPRIRESHPLAIGSVHPRLPHHPPRPDPSLLRPRIHPRPVRRQAPTRGPLPESLDLVARSDGHRDDVLRGLNERHVQERRQPAARLDLGTGPVGVVRPGLLRVQPVGLRVDAPDCVLLVTPGKVDKEHAVEAKFKPSANRLEALKEKHEKGLLASVDFLKALLTLAKDTVAAEKEADEKAPAPEDADRGKAALTTLFEEVRTKKTPIIVARVVADIDAIVKPVRFDGWQRTSGGERAVKQALRQALLQYKLHADQELFDRAYGYIKQYY
jgi:hypothetical protein